MAVWEGEKNMIYAREKSNEYNIKCKIENENPIWLNNIKTLLLLGVNNRHSTK